MDKEFTEADDEAAVQAMDHPPAVSSSFPCAPFVRQKMNTLKTTINASQRFSWMENHQMMLWESESAISATNMATFNFHTAVNGDVGMQWMRPFLKPLGPILIQTTIILKLWPHCKLQITKQWLNVPDRCDWGKEEAHIVDMRWWYFEASADRVFWWRARDARKVMSDIYFLALRYLNQKSFSTWLYIIYCFHAESVTNTRALILFSAIRCRIPSRYSIFVDIPTPHLYRLNLWWLLLSLPRNSDRKIFRILLAHRRHCHYQRIEGQDNARQWTGFLWCPRLWPALFPGVRGMLQTSDQPSIGDISSWNRESCRPQPFRVFLNKSIGFTTMSLSYIPRLCLLLPSTYSRNKGWLSGLPTWSPH